MVSSFSVVRCRVELVPAREESLALTDLAVPLVDGVQLFEKLGDRWPGVDVGLVAPPSRHWLGQPVYQEEGRAVILDGECGCAGCCGVMARITLDGPVVVWSDFFARGRPPLPQGLRFEFHRSAYEAAIAAVLNSEPKAWVFDLEGYEGGD